MKVDAFVVLVAAVILAGCAPKSSVDDPAPDDFSHNASPVAASDNSSHARADCSACFDKLPMIASLDGVLRGIDAVRVVVSLNDAVKKVISEDRVTNKFELTLRKHSIELNDEAPVSLIVSFEGLWDESELRLTYSFSSRLYEPVAIKRAGELHRTIAPTWDKGSFGYAGKDVAEKTIIDTVEELAESFANKYLANCDREPAAPSGN